MKLTNEQIQRHFETMEYLQMNKQNPADLMNTLRQPQENKDPEWASPIYLNKLGYPINKSFAQRFDPPETETQKKLREERK